MEKHEKESIQLPENAFRELKSGEQTNVAVEKSQVVGNISANATKRHGDLAGV